MNIIDSRPFKARRMRSHSSLLLPHPRRGPRQEDLLSYLGDNESLIAATQLIERDREINVDRDKIETLKVTTHFVIAIAFMLVLVSLGLLLHNEPATLVILFACLGLISSVLGYITDLLYVRIKRQSPLFQFMDSRVRTTHMISANSCILIAALSLVSAHYGWFDRSLPPTPRQSIRKPSPAVSDAQASRLSKDQNQPVPVFNW